MADTDHNTGVKQPVTSSDSGKTRPEPLQLDESLDVSVTPQVESAGVENPTAVLAAAVAELTGSMDSPQQDGSAGAGLAKVAHTARTSKENELGKKEEPETEDKAGMPSTVTVRNPSSEPKPEPATGEEPFCFEGPEKCLEVDFCVGSGEFQEGLRDISRPVWDALLKSCGCEIISIKSNADLDSYVLSESSMFIYRWKMILKTCGKTTPLCAIPHLQKICKNHKMEMEWMGFSRKNYIFPVLQIQPHTNFSQEVRYIQDTLQRGEGHILGPLTGDHWYLYVAELTTNYTHPQTDFKIDMMMYGLDPAAAAKFLNPSGDRSAKEVRDAIQFEKFLVGAKVHDVLFEPCGYSLNAMKDDTYYTMHVTPEAEFSYASFETNLDAKSYEALVQYILGIFNPQRFTITVFYDVEETLDGTVRAQPRQNPLDQTIYTALDSRQKYQRCLKTESQFLGEYMGGIGNWIRVDRIQQRTPKTRAANRGLATRSSPAF